MNETVLITGASRGIGRAIALEFAKNGYHIVATCKKNKELLDELGEQIIALGAGFDSFLCDHSDFNNAHVLIEKIKKRNLSVDILINNVGISTVGLLQDITADEWSSLWNTNVTSTVALCREIIPIMLEKEGGKIINISSVWGNIGASCECAYSATKGAVNSFTKALAKELAPSNIQVNAVSCGIINTDMNAHLSKEDIHCICEDIPAGRVGTPAEIAKSVFLLANAPAYLTGQVVTVDGGWT